MHPETGNFAPAFADGPTAVRPAMLSDKLPLYFLPCIERQSLLFQPLLFHEFGHVQYERHQTEMDDLVAQLQHQITRQLLPFSMRNDGYIEAQAGWRQAVVSRWYTWVQEIFCDATGLLMGGPSFLRAFSAYLRLIKQGDYILFPVNLQGSSHPVTWLRIQFLNERAQTLGFGSVAESIIEEWTAVARAMNVTAEHYGYYDPAIGRLVNSAVDKMLAESTPRSCTPKEAAGGGWEAGSDSIVQLLNWAWQVYSDKPDRYPLWEASVVQQLLMRDDPVDE